MVIDTNSKMYCIFITFDCNYNCKLIKDADGEKEIMLQNTLIVQLLFAVFFLLI